MNMSAKATKIMERYMKNYVTDTQLAKYLALGVITEDEYNYIYATKHPVVEDEEDYNDLVDDPDMVDTEDDAEV